MENKTKKEPKNKRLKIEYLSKDSTKGFSMLAGINRDIIPQHVTRLTNSIEKMGVLRPVLIATIEFITGLPIKYIIDGQHLYHACLRLNIEIPYTYINIKDDLDMISKLALLNTSSKSWNMKDYVKVWGYKKDEYIRLNRYHNTYDVELSQLAEILMNNTCTIKNCGGNSYSKYIKNGTFTIKNEPLAIILLDRMTDALKIVPRMDRASNKFFIGSYIGFMTNTVAYDHELFIKNLKFNKDKFKLATQDPDEFKKLLKEMLK